MKIFVASWYYPPINTSEAICCYKLLRNSKFSYDVFSSLSKSWCYDNKLQTFDEKNIRSFNINTCNINKWAKAAYKKFIKLNKKEKYDCFMTRSMPEESVYLGLKIKKKFPHIKWIASFADPVGNNPYMLKIYVDNDNSLNASQKFEIKNVLKSNDISLITKLQKKTKSALVKRLCSLRIWELEALKYADLIIGPTEELLNYINGSWSEKYFVVPHNYDLSFYKKLQKKENEKVTFTFLGLSDTLRSLTPFVKAVNILKKKDNNLVKNIKVNFIGTIADDTKKIINRFKLNDIIEIKKSVDYFSSLELMQESDWLIHVDAFFKELGEGGSLFLAGKIADYLGANKPIFGLTGINSPAYKVISKSGGVVSSNSPKNIAESLERIIKSKRMYSLDQNYIATYNSKYVSRKFDTRVQELFGKKKEIDEYLAMKARAIPNPKHNKYLSICIPSYNVEKTLDKCLCTLLNHNMRNFLEILVIDDGSSDKTNYIASTYSKEFNEIIKVIKKENGGHGSTINRAIECASGKYFMVVDGDDWVESKKFEELIRYIGNLSTFPDLIVNPYKEMYMDTLEIKRIKQEARIKYYQIYDFSELDGEELYFALPCCVYKTEILKNLNIKFLEKSFYVDCEYMLFPIHLINSVIFTDKEIYVYRKGNPNQSVSISSYSNRFDQHDNVCRRLVKFYSKNKMNKPHRLYYEHILIAILYSHYTLPLNEEFDKNKGAKIVSNFDSFLKSSSKKLYSKLYSYNVIKKIKAKKFNYKKLSVIFDQSRITPRTIIRRILINKLTLRIIKSRFFSTSIGKKIKKYLKRIFGRA